MEGHITSYSQESEEAYEGVMIHSGFDRIVACRVTFL